MATSGNDTDWNSFMRQPLDEPGFANMFGAPAAAMAPRAYHLMLLGDHGGLDILFNFHDLLGCARLVSRHEEAFSWLAMSRDGAAIHCALLDCIIHECCSQAGTRSMLARSSTAVRTPAKPFEGSMLAFALAEPGQGGMRAIEAVERVFATLMPAARLCRIEPALSYALARALPSAEKSERARLIEIASDAIAIGAASRGASSAPAIRL
jgi:hypothetical protein